MPINVAIIGSGPSGFYAADALLKTGIDCRIDIIERLPTPYGLIRAGVAPDHQSTKRVSRAYERTATNPAVRFYGNVAVGTDASLAALRELYDAVVLAVGMPRDRTLAIPGEDKAGVHGSADFVGWYNGHPDFAHLDPDLSGTTVTVVGNGNVAIDIARVLVKTRAEMATSDIPEYAAAAIERSPLTDVYMFGRRGPVEAKFTNVELREMGELTNAVPIVDPAQLPAAVEGEMSDRDRRLRERNLATLREFTAADPTGKAKRVHFAFYSKPVEVLGDAKVTGLRLEHTRVEDGRAVGTGTFLEVPCGAVIAAIGYRAEPLEGVPFNGTAGTVLNADGRIDDGLYAVGWIKRGPTGVIGTNKADGDVVAKRIATEVGDGGKAGHVGLERLLRQRGTRWVTFADWQRLDAMEVANAASEAPRCKFVTVQEMLVRLDQTADAPAS